MLKDIRLPLISGKMLEVCGKIDANAAFRLKIGFANAHPAIGLPWLASQELIKTKAMLDHVFC